MESPTVERTGQRVNKLSRLPCGSRTYVIGMHKRAELYMAIDCLVARTSHERVQLVLLYNTFKILIGASL